MAGGHGFVESLAIHVADHQDAAGLGVLHDGGDQAALLIEIQLSTHRNVPKKQKARQFERASNIAEFLIHVSRPAVSCHPVMVKMAAVMNANHHEISV